MALRPLSEASGWLLSLGIPLIYGGLSATVWLHQPYVIQDDTRQHGVWMLRWMDPELFPNDWILDYFQSVAPLGYQGVYQLAMRLGISPLAWAKVLPVLLAVLASFFLYRLTLRLFPVTLGAVLAVLLFNQQIWLNDDLVSASPRAFTYPIFAAFLDFLAAGSLWPCLGAIALQGLFFPQLVLLAVAVLTVRLVKVSGRSLHLSTHRQDYRFWLAGMGVAIAVLIPFALPLSDYGPVVTAEQMRAMPEYLPGGRNAFFRPFSWRMLFKGASGPGLPAFPTVVLLGFVLPFLPSRRFPLVSRMTPGIRLLLDLGVAALGLFGLAHGLLLRLHFPNRYTYHTWRFVLPIAAAMVLVVLLERFWHWWGDRHTAFHGPSPWDRFRASLVVLTLLVLLLIPLAPPLLRSLQIWIVGSTPELYTYLAHQPKDIRVASLAREANNIPAFAHRSLLVGREFSLPHHSRYYAEIRRRAEATVRGQYTSDPAILRQVIERDALDYWLLDADAFDPAYLPRQDWLIHSSFQGRVVEAIAQLDRGERPAIAQQISSCTVLNTHALILLDTHCFRFP